MARRLLEVLSLESYITLGDGPVEPSLDLHSAPGETAYLNDVAVESNQIEWHYALGDAESTPLADPLFSTLIGDVANWTDIAVSSGSLSLGVGESGLDGRLIRTLVEEVVSHRLRNRSIP